MAIVARAGAEQVLERMRCHRNGKDARIIGEVVDDHPGMVVLRTGIGGSRILDLMMGEQLPRIC